MVRKAARGIFSADGVTFVLREGLGDHRVVKRPAGEWQHKTCGKKITATQWVTSIEWS